MSDFKPPSQNRPGAAPDRARTAILRTLSPLPTSIKDGSGPKTEVRTDVEARESVMGLSLQFAVVGVAPPSTDNSYRLRHSVRLRNRRSVSMSPA